MAAILSWTLEQFTVRDDGQDLIEYGLLVGLISLVAFTMVTEVGEIIGDVFWATIAATTNGL